MRAPLPPRLLPRSLRGGSGSARAGVLDIGLVNNMPDSALKGTERQFQHLLDGAAGARIVRLHLFTLPEIARSERARAHCAGRYGGLDELLASRLDALIVTGAEPRTPSLAGEAYWNSLTAVFEWAAANTASVLLSCLAAHASVLHFDGIARRRLARKRLGVFAHMALAAHPLTRNAVMPWRIAHSRWNELDEAALEASGYAVLTRSPQAGVDLFAKQHGRSLFVHCQGHPEYDPDTLLREYQRDVRRFVNSEQDSYPNMPRGYFSPAGRRAAARLRARMLAGRNPEAMEPFPPGLLRAGDGNDWSAPARCLYGNWLELVAEGQRPRQTQLRLLPATPAPASA